jgi:NAD(P)-dependent dehydrogenase (short-subunit alcohol dehydrogenase family)
MEKVALITGAARGLGLYLTKECLNRGYKVLAMARETHSNLQQLKDQYTEKIVILNADMCDYEAIKKCRIEAEKAVKHIDIIVNNVGVWFDYERLPLDDARFDFDMILKEFDINSLGPLRIIREFFDLVKKSELKTIINISSEAGSMSMHSWRKGEFAYCMSKASLNCASNIIDFAYKEDGIKVYAVDPGWMKTNMGGETAEVEPTESATDIINLAEAPKKDFIFCNRKGEKYDW